jgi:hypothetical protein
VGHVGHRALGRLDLVTAIDVTLAVDHALGFGDLLAGGLVSLDDDRTDDAAALRGSGDGAAVDVPGAI